METQNKRKPSGGTNFQLTNWHGPRSTKQVVTLWDGTLLRLNGRPCQTVSLSISNHDSLRCPAVPTESCSQTRTQILTSPFQLTRFNKTNYTAPVRTLLALHACRARYIHSRGSSESRVAVYGLKHRHYIACIHSVCYTVTTGGMLPRGYGGGG
jgi:hypothetical protein